MKKQLKDFGDHASGVVVDISDWGGYNPRILKPRRRAAGTVSRLFAAAPNVVGITTATGEQVNIRTDLQ